MTRVFKGEWVRLRDTNTLVLVVDSYDPNAIVGIKYANSKSVLTIVRQDVEKVAYEEAINDMQDTFRLVSAPLSADTFVFDAGIIAEARVLLADAAKRFWDNQKLQEALYVGIARLHPRQ